MVTVSRFEKTFTNTGNFPCSWAILSCGHAASIVLKPQGERCDACGVERDRPEPWKRCGCGCGVFYVTFSPNRHKDADFVTQIGDAVDCETCQREVEQIEWLRGLDRSTVLHSRLRHGSYHFYRRAPESPSGKLLIGSVMVSPKIEAVLNELRYSPLSPTEGLQDGRI